MGNFYGTGEFLRPTGEERRLFCLGKRPIFDYCNEGFFSVPEWHCTQRLFINSLMSVREHSATCMSEMISCLIYQNCLTSNQP